MSEHTGVAVDKLPSSTTSGLEQAAPSMEPAALHYWAGGHVASWEKSLVNIFGNAQHVSGLSPITALDL
jgi:hypothetical protein